MAQTLSLCLALVVLVGAGYPQHEIADASPALADAEFAGLRQRIRPRESELSWQDLPWLTTYHEGLKKAAEQGRPLLLWVMNGHPLGCT